MDALHRMGLRVAMLGLRAWWAVAHPRIRGVAVLVWHEERLLLIRNSYRRSLTVPGGRRRRRESPVEAAARELREEVGLHVEPGRLRLAAELVVPHSNVIDHVHLFELRCEREPEVRVDRREVVHGAFHSREAALALPLWRPLEVYLRGEPGYEAGGDA